MVSLKCNVATCLHNEDNYCCKQAIQVDGEHAKNVQGTCCGSFDNRGEESYRNVYENPNASLQVGCEAVNCVYNQSKICKASKIDITGSSANTSTQTACATFQAK